MKKFAIIFVAAASFCGCKQAENVSVEIRTLGQTQSHPNSVVAAVNAPEGAKVTWTEDGKKMGEMAQVDNVLAYLDNPDAVFYAAVPGVDAERVSICVKPKGGKKMVYDLDLTTIVDVQAHRGGMGLMPENSLPAMKNSVDLGVNTLEMDLVVSKDHKVLLSHDPYFHHRYSTRPDGTPVKRGEPAEYIYTMPYDSIAKYDVGMKFNDDWPEKQCIPAVKPLASDVITFIENYRKENGLDPMKYNIEIKSDYGDEEGTGWPEYKEFVDICAPLLASFGLGDRLIVQSFDDRALNYLHDNYPEFTLSYLIRDHDVDFEKFMSLLDFQPEWLSPPHQNVTAEFMAEARKRGMKVVTWTVDEPEEMERLIGLGVDGIISNHPDRLLKVTRGYSDLR